MVLPPEEVRQFLQLANSPEVKTWLEGKAASPGASADQPLADAISNWGTAVELRVAAVASAIKRVPAEVAAAMATYKREVNSGAHGLVAIVFASLFMVGLGLEWIVRVILLQKEGGQPGDPVRKALSEAVALLTFSLASIGLFPLFEWPPLLHKAAIVLLLAYVLFRLNHGISRFLLAFEDVDKSLNDKSDSLDHVSSSKFWLRRIDLVAGCVLTGWTVVSLMPSLGFSADVTRLGAFGFGLGVLTIGIEAVWRRPGVPKSSIVFTLLTLYMIMLWFAWVIGLVGIVFIGIYSIILPGVTRRTGVVAQAMADRTQLSGSIGVVLKVMIVRGARALVVAVAVSAVAYAWRFSAAALASSEVGRMLVNGLLNAIVILLVADLVWQTSKALIAYRMDLAERAGGSEDQLTRSGRLRTLLPIFRNTLAVLISAIAVLTILSGLGVQIGPLIAGAGIFGVAIGFGSQTLVKDVLSGVFYMLDDAFRVGEYIQSGSYKGTVESFSLRSVRLRHHRGPIFTVPFGQLGAVENMSRDWVIEKMTINVTYDSDIDLARKLIKQVGKELAADPEFAADTLQPLKMQGVDSFGDFAIVLRLKLMTKPGLQFAIKRRALMMIKKIFDENGIKIAVPTVHVEGSGDPAAAAHELQQSMKKTQIAEATGQTVA